MKRVDQAYFPAQSARLALPTMPQRSTVYAANGKVLATLDLDYNRKIVTLDQVAPIARQAVLAVEDPGVSQELRLSMCQRDLRELAEVWEALQQPYRLSVCYEIRVTQIDSTRTQRTGRVMHRLNNFQNAPQAVGG